MRHAGRCRAEGGARSAVVYDEVDLAEDLVLRHEAFRTHSRREGAKRRDVALRADDDEDVERQFGKFVDGPPSNVQSSVDDGAERHVHPGAA